MPATNSHSPKYIEKRQQALDAAAHVFAEKGFHGASTGDIAAAMGIKQGSLYYYFSSKEEALEEVCVAGLAGYLKRMELAIAAADSVEDGLYSVIRNHLMSYAEDDDRLLVHNKERLYLPKVRRRRLKALGRKYRRELQQLIQKGIESDDLRADVDPKFAAQAVIGICNAFGERVFRRMTISVDELSKHCTGLLLEGLQPRFS